MLASVYEVFRFFFYTDDVNNIINFNSQIFFHFFQPAQEKRSTLCDPSVMSGAFNLTSLKFILTRLYSLLFKNY